MTSIKEKKRVSGSEESQKNAFKEKEKRVCLI
jgi:hypothetical protein